MASISISPVGILGLMASASRRRTLPTAATTYSGRTCSPLAWPSGVSSLSSTIWAMPVRSRRSRKMRLPWSRRRFTQPIRTTCWPAWAARNSPQCASVRDCLENRALAMLILLGLALAVLRSGTRRDDSQLRARNLGLYACGEVLHCQDTGLELVFAEDDDAAGGLVGGFEGLLEAETAVAQFDRRGRRGAVRGPGPAPRRSGSRPAAQYTHRPPAVRQHFGRAGLRASARAGPRPWQSRCREPWVRRCASLRPS